MGGEVLCDRPPAALLTFCRWPCSRTASTASVSPGNHVPSATEPLHSPGLGAQSHASPSGLRGPFLAIGRWGEPAAAPERWSPVWGDALCLHPERVGTGPTFTPLTGAGSPMAQGPERPLGNARPKGTGWQGAEGAAAPGNTLPPPPQSPCCPAPRGFKGAWWGGGGNPCIFLGQMEANSFLFISWRRHSGRERGWGPALR